MRAVWSSPGSQTFQGNNAALYVQGQNTIKTQFSISQQQLLIDHQQENAPDGGAADTIMFHMFNGFVLNDNKATLSTTRFSIDANEGASGTANWVLSRRVRRKLR
jgi:hypothetical protein